MELQEITQRLQAGEDSRHQFKESFQSIDQLAVEMSALANSQGGHILVGVDDRGQIIGLPATQVRRLNQWISNAATQKIEPPLFVQTQTLLIKDQTVLIIEVPLGSHKPYGVNRTEFWVKNGADKRRATREELLRLMQASSRLYADEMPTEVPGDQVDTLWFTRYYQMAFNEELTEEDIQRPTLLENLKLVHSGRLTLAGLLLFAKNPGRHRPQFTIKGTVYLDPDIFRDKEDVEGNLFEQRRRGVDFILRNLQRRQQAADFNAPGVLEIPAQAIKEVVANALIHRDYFIDAPIFLNLFPDRLEVASPGVLPNTITVENIKAGIHLERNPILLSLVSKDPDFGYTGRGSGIPRVLRLCREKNVAVSFLNDTERNMFRVIFERPAS